MQPQQTGTYLSPEQVQAARQQAGITPNNDVTGSNLMQQLQSNSFSSQPKQSQQLGNQNSSIIQQGNQLLKDNENTSLLGGNGKQNIGTTVAEDATAPLATVGNFIGKGIKAAGDATGLTKPYNSVINTIADHVTNNPEITSALNKVNSFLDANPDLAKDVNSGILAAGFTGGEGAVNEISSGTKIDNPLAINAPAEDITNQKTSEPTITSTKPGMQNPKQMLTPASTQAKSAVTGLPKDVVAGDINNMESAAKARLVDNNNPVPSKVMGHTLASESLHGPEEGGKTGSITSQMNEVGTTKDAAIESMKDKPILDKNVPKDIAAKLETDTEDIDSSDKGMRKLDNFKNELHMLSTGQQTASVGGQKIYVPGAADHVPTIGDVDAFIDKWQKKDKFSDSEAQKAINSSLGQLNDHLKASTDQFDNGAYRKANEDFFKLYDARDKARGILGSKDANTGLYNGSSTFNKSFSSDEQPLAGLQKVTGQNLSQRAAIADAFDATVNASDKNNALKNLRVSMNPLMTGARTGLSLVIKDLESPEALASKLRALAKVK